MGLILGLVRIQTWDWHGYFFLHTARCWKQHILNPSKGLWSLLGALGLGVRHERDSRQSQSRSGEVSKVSRRYISGFRLKVPFSLVKAAGKLRLGTTLNGTPAVHFCTFQRSDRGTEPTKTMPGKERQCSVQVRSWKKFRSSTVEVKFLRLLLV